MISLRRHDPRTRRFTGFAYEEEFQEELDLIRRIVLCGLIVCGVILAATTFASAADVGEKRGELGVQLGVRWVDRQIVPDDSRGFGWVPGIQGAWALNDRWAVFGDINLSTQDSKEFCSMTDVCNALTPESLIKAITVGFERRFKPGPKNGRWVLGLGAGWIDVEWNGAQLHKGMWSLSFGRRTPLGHGFGVLRWCLRVENGIGIGVDPQLTGSLKRFRMTNAVFLVGWGAGFGGRY